MALDDEVEGAGAAIENRGNQVWFGQCLERGVGNLGFVPDHRHVPARICPSVERHSQWRTHVVDSIRPANPGARYTRAFGDDPDLDIQ